ncbi:hypothetical protein QE152_g31481 [Popillia japonica]|uniref:Polyprotein n=1 Tax=Popillia japonica TaxID=7064 RepID=A0AAW1J1H6_POPJA
MSIVDDLDDILTRFAELTIFDDMAQINLSMRDYSETIPHFDGDPLNIFTFISSCDSFVQTLARPNDAAFNRFLFRAIISKLKGKAAQIASVRNTTSWDALRTLLVNTFSDQRNELTLISALQRLEQYSNESAIDFEERCLNQLSLLTARINVTEQNAALRQNKIDLYRGLTLQTFINGLREPMRIIKQCKTPANLEEALNYAQEQENLQMQKHRQTYMFKTNPPKSAHPPQKSFIPVTVPKFVIPQPSQQNFHNNFNRSQPTFNNFQHHPQFPQSNFNNRPQFQQRQSFQPFKPPTQMTRNTQGNKSILPKPTPMDWSSYSGLPRKQINFTEANAHGLVIIFGITTIYLEELFYQEDPYQDEAAALDYNYYYPEEYTYEIPQTEENTNDPSPEHVEEAENFRITASETTAEKYPHIHKEEVRKQISSMLEQNIIRQSTSPWSSPVWIVPKKLDASGKQKWRMVIDYRKLNEHTIDDKYPLPNITDVLDKLVNIDDEELEELLHTDENIRLSAEEIENIINDLEEENDLIDTINSNMEDGPPNSISIQEEVINIHTDENIRLSAEEIENIINDLEEENDLIDTINSNMEDGPPNSIST